MVLKLAYIPYVLACHLQINADPDPSRCADPDPTFQFDADGI
jgi:hypothetical protein